MANTVELIDDSHCFVCGQDNPSGLKLHWETSGHTTKTQFTPNKSHQGWKNVVHGGILAAILDEAMTRLAWQIHGTAVTAEITVRYRAMARVGEKLTIQADIDPGTNRLINTKAEIINSQGETVATASGKAIRISNTQHVSTT
jgi:uncharacterized protein (TIGR00369 family)